MKKSKSKYDIESKGVNSTFNIMESKPIEVDTVLYITIDS